MIYNFADDNTIYDCGKDLSNDLENLKHDMKILLKWFKTNSLQAALGKEKKKQNSVKLITNSIENEKRKKSSFTRYHNR